MYLAGAIIDVAVCNLEVKIIEHLGEAKGTKIKIYVVF